ncbi:MAG: hypothetical protein AAFX79_09485 [Planctomycetota bacterium]
MTRRALIAIVAASLAGAPAAYGQTALGDGRRLDRNLLRGSGGLNVPVRDFQSELRLRNAIVTGNAPNGLSFRGDVGFEDTFEFREFVGSDDLFTFRRDAFTSGLAGAGIRGTEALQFQLALTVGNRPPRNLRGSLLTSRTGDRLTPELRTQLAVSMSNAQPGLREADPEELLYPLAGTSLRSTSSFVSGRSLSPAMLMMAESEDGRTLGLVASPLRGLAREQLVGDAEAGEDEPEEVNPARAPSLRLGGEEDSEDDRDMSETQLDLRVRLDAYEQARAGAEGDREGQADRPLGSFEDRIEALRRALQREFVPQGDEEDPSALPGFPATPEPAQGEAEDDPTALRSALDPAEAARAPLPPTQAQAAAGTVADWEALLETLRQGTGVVTAPSPELDSASEYELHVVRAKALMGEARYFEAEQRFTMALAARPEDPIALVGRVHAQLGAGLDLSASVNLRSFLLAYPEFVGARYEDGLLPRSDRIAAAKSRMLAQLRGESRRKLPRESAMLLAYVGFQSGDAIAVRVGLDRLADGVEGRRDPLVPLLRGVWLQPAAAGGPGR